MVSRHYWPHLGIESARQTVRLADALTRSGIEIEVWTPHYGSGWPDELTHREITVHRPAAAPRSDWSMGRYLRQLAYWLDQNGGRFDLMFVATIRNEASVVVSAARQHGCPVVLQHSGSGRSADDRQWDSMRHGRRIVAAARSADAILVSRVATLQRLVGREWPAERIHRIVWGITPTGPALPDDASARQQSRRALKAINADLAVDRDSLVVGCCGEMEPWGGMMTLARAIPDLVSVWPDLRFWFVGDGSMRNEIYRHFKHEGVRQNIAMPGTFVDWDDIFRVLDLLVIPSSSDSLDETLASAIASAVPVVIADASESRQSVGEAAGGVTWFEEDNPESLHDAIKWRLIDPVAAKSVAVETRKQLLVGRPFSETIAQYIQLFSTLVESRSRKVAPIAPRPNSPQSSLTGPMISPSPPR